MRKLDKGDNQLGTLDPEKIYFVEKFGYLIKKINGGYGRTVQDALYTRINSAVNDFNSDLPNIVYNLEKSLKRSESDRSINKEETKSTESTVKSVSLKKTEDASITLNDKIDRIQKNISDKIKAAQQLKSEIPLEKQKLIDPEKILFTDDGSLPKRSSSILRPSIATIREQQRLKQIKMMQQTQGSVVPKSVSVPTFHTKQTTKKKPMPVQEFTEWEKKWHKYDNDFSNE